MHAFRLRGRANRALSHLESFRSQTRPEDFGPAGTYVLMVLVGAFAFWATCQFAASLEVPV